MVTWIVAHQRERPLRAAGPVPAHERHTGAALPPFPYACTCGRRGCDDVQLATTADYR